MITKTDGTNPYETGDVVQLKSGGPAMTVIWPSTVRPSLLECNWYDIKGRLQHGSFHFKMLRIVPNQHLSDRCPDQTSVVLHGYAYPVYK
jgi:uncharacterized protein YodC (DUF2158 family)